MSTDITLYLNISRLILGIIILSYASYTDLKTRMASNILWVIMGTIGAILLAVEYLTGNITNPIILIFIPIMIFLVYIFFQMRLLFGGADAKALMALAILVPIQPIINNLPILGISYMPASWTIFSNSLIIFLFIPLALLFYNLAKGNPKLPHAFLGYKMKLTEARNKFVWPLEKLENGKTRLVMRPKGFDTQEELDEFEKQGIKEIWVTPKIPFMIPLLAGFIFTFIFGDILYSLMQIFV